MPRRRVPTRPPDAVRLASPRVGEAQRGRETLGYPPITWITSSSRAPPRDSGLTPTYRGRQPATRRSWGPAEGPSATWATSSVNMPTNGAPVPGVVTSDDRPAPRIGWHLQGVRAMSGTDRRLPAMRSAERQLTDRVLAAARAPGESALPGNARVALRQLVAWAPDRWPGIGDGLVALVEYAHDAGYVDALADVDALAAELVDVRDLPETRDPG